MESTSEEPRQVCELAQGQRVPTFAASGIVAEKEDLLGSCIPLSTREAPSSSFARRSAPVMRISATSLTVRALVNPRLEDLPDRRAPASPTHLTLPTDVATLRVLPVSGGTLPIGKLAMSRRDRAGEAFSAAPGINGANRVPDTKNRSSAAHPTRCEVNICPRPQISPRAGEAASPGEAVGCKKRSHITARRNCDVAFRHVRTEKDTQPPCPPRSRLSCSRPAATPAGMTSSCYGGMT
jgi:hypothetical protein